MSKPIVSIITPVYNAARFIEETYDSVKNQILQEWEWVLVDDQSTDDSFQLLLELSVKDERLKVHQLPENSGSGPARNLAIDLAQGTYLAFLDSDDIWTENKLSRHVSFMEKHQAAFSHTSYGFMNEAGEVINQTYHVSNKPVTYKDLLKRTEISCLTAMYNQDLIGKFYMPDLRRKQDYALWLSILKAGHHAIPLDEELAFYRQVKGSATNNKFKLIIKHLKFLREVEGLSVLHSLYFSFHWGINGVKKYYL